MSEKSTEKLIIKPDDIVATIQKLNRERRTITNVQVLAEDKGYVLHVTSPRRKQAHGQDK